MCLPRWSWSPCSVCASWLPWHQKHRCAHRRCPHHTNHRGQSRSRSGLPGLAVLLSMRHSVAGLPAGHAVVGAPHLLVPHQGHIGPAPVAQSVCTYALLIRERLFVFSSSSSCTASVPQLTAYVQLQSRRNTRTDMNVPTEVAVGGTGFMPSTACYIVSVLYYSHIHVQS
jgi:hypothetical protein